MQKRTAQQDLALITTGITKYEPEVVVSVVGRHLNLDTTITDLQKLIRMAEGMIQDIQDGQAGSIPTNRLSDQARKVEDRLVGYQKFTEALAVLAEAF